MIEQIPFNPHRVSQVTRIDGHTVLRPFRDHPNKKHLAAVRAARRLLQRDSNGDVYCATCWSVDTQDRPLEAHHRHYNDFGKERVSDIVLICPDCHEAITERFRSARLDAGAEAIREYFFPGAGQVH